MDVDKKINTEKYSSAVIKDLIVLALVIFILLVFSYFFDFFILLVALFQKNPEAITYIDEVITLLITLSLGLAVFSWRRWKELKQETAKRIKFQEELIMIANTKAETERIISKQLHCEIELHKLDEKIRPGMRPEAKK